MLRNIRDRYARLDPRVKVGIFALVLSVVVLVAGAPQGYGG